MKARIHGKWAAKLLSCRCRHTRHLSWLGFMKENLSQARFFPSQNAPQGGDGRWGKMEKNKIIPCTQSKAWAGWPKHLRLVQATPWADFAVITAQLWQLFSCDLDSRITAKYSKYQTSFYSMQVSFRFHSLKCSEILVSPSICTRIRTWRFHRTEEVSNIFPVSWHITHILMTISTNLRRDTDHNSTKLVCSYPLAAGKKYQAKCAAGKNPQSIFWTDSWWVVYCFIVVCNFCFTIHSSDLIYLQLAGL